MSRLRALLKAVFGWQSNAPPEDEPSEDKPPEQKTPGQKTPEHRPREENAELLRRRASTALRLAKEIADDRAAPELRALAAEFEARAAQLSPQDPGTTNQRPQDPAPAGKLAMLSPHRLWRSA